MADTKKETFKRAVLWEAAGDGKVGCFLCNWRCLIAEGKLGRCAVRKNLGGELVSLNYHKVCAANVDPIEKKPLFHFLPGSRSFSISAPGCNFQCVFCQNWQISQEALEGRIEGEAIEPAETVEAAVRTKCKSIAYTYTEPTIFMELCADCAVPAREKGIANVFVSNGFMTREAIDFSKGWLDAINVDIKAFSEDYYRKLCKARLKPVLDTVEYIAKNTSIWMEITTLIVPERNDSEDELKRLAEFIVNRAGAEVPWHISRFFPQYKYQDSYPTPIETIERAAEIGRAAGLRYVYIGNVPGGEGENTVCHKCGKLLVKRAGYSVTVNNINDSACPDCGTKAAVRWE
jgi:pyruvate formate lyase activating enzyme